MSKKKYQTLDLVILALLSVASSQSLLAGEIDSVCTTNERTLRSIQSDADQTLWIFMQTVCRGEFVLTKSSPVEERPLPKIAQTEATAPPKRIERLESHESPSKESIGHLMNAPKSLASFTVPPKAATSPSSIEVTSVKKSPPQVIRAEKEISGRDVLNEPVMSIAKPVEVASVFVGESISGPNTDVLVSQPVVEVVGDATSEQSSKDTSVETSPTSKYPWIYSLLDGRDLAGAGSQLPSPLEYQPSRFSTYKPNYIAESTASNTNRGLIQKPSAMSVVPQGFYFGTSLYWEQDLQEPSATNSYSVLPSLIVGYADEKAVREHQSYAGLGSRFELSAKRIRDDEDRTKYNTFTLGGEIYLPVGGGLFTGLGGLYKYSRIPITSLGEEIDSIREGVYLPVGVGFTTSAGHSGKVQLNTLIGARDKGKFSQVTAFSASDATVKFGFGDALGLNLAYSWSANSEVFIDYWRIGKTKPYTFSVNGAELTEQTDKQWWVETGMRFYW